MPLLRWAAASALPAVLLLAVAGCAADPSGEDSSAGSASGSGLPGEGEPPGAGGRPVVQVAEGGGSQNFLDPDAAPTSALGRLRARYLPVWTPEFDWAFPPEACGTAWELDGIAAPSDGSLAVLGDPAAASALTVMRYEHQFTSALAAPEPLGQLCVATASVGPARRGALDVLVSYLDSGVRRREPAAFPEAVRVLGASPTEALAVACVQPGYAEVVSADGAVVEAPRAPARLQAYLMTLARGLEDQVADLSYRVWEASHRPAEDCAELEGWTAEWQAQVQAWIDEGQLWSPLAAEVTVQGLCDSPPARRPRRMPPRLAPIGHAPTDVTAASHTDRCDAAITSA